MRRGPAFNGDTERTFDESWPAVTWFYRDIAWIWRHGVSADSACRAAIIGGAG